MKNKTDGLPTGWEYVSLGEVFVIERGGSPRPIEDYITEAEDGINWIKIGDTKGVTKYIYKTKEKIRPEGIQRSRMVYEDDFILSNSMSFGRPYIMKTKGCIHDGWLVIRTNKEIIDTNYLYYILSSSFVYQQFSTLAKGSTVKNLNIEAVKQVNIFLSPLPEQHRIVARIEELFSDLDKGIESLKTAQQQLKVYRQAVLKWAFEGRLTNKDVKEGKLPEGWTWKTINKIGKIETGTTPPKSNTEYYSNEYPFYKPTDLEAGNDVQNSRDGLSKLGLKKARYVPEYATLVTCIGATIGKTGLIKKGGGFNQQINAIIPFDEFAPKYVYYQAIAPYFQEQIKNNASATTLPILNKGRFEILEMVICSLAEQHRIVSEIEDRLSVCDKMEESISQSLQQAEALRQSILKKAFEGKLVQQDPNDEPAGVLLERIRGERGKARKTNPSRPPL